MKRLAKLTRLQLTFDRGVMAQALHRFDEDPLFRERQGRLAVMFHRAMSRTGLIGVLDRIPGDLATPMIMRLVRHGPSWVTEQSFRVYGNACMTKMTALLTLGISLVAVAISQLAFKAAFTRLAEHWAPGHAYGTTAWRVAADPLIWTAVVLVLLGAACWYLAMIRLPLSLMLPMASVISPIVSIGAYFMLGESLTPAKVAAILMIAAGVAWLGWLNT